jgi:glycosyltransferase involved in cell wall biosynthesis
MRIAIITERVNRHGGQERVVAEIAERMSRFHEIHLFCFSAEGLRGERLTIHPMWCPFSSSTLEGFWILPASVFALRDRHFDAILSQGGNSLVGNFTLLHTCHALRAHRTQEVEWRYHPPSIPRRMFQSFRSRFSLYFERLAVQRCRGAVMTVSQFLKDYVMQQHRLADSDVFVTENGVSHETFHPGLREVWREPIRRELGIGPDEFVVLFVGGRWFDKGVPFLVEALGAMQDRRAHLVVVGKGDIEFFTEFAATHGVRDRVHFAAPTSEPERYYAMADCFGFPSDAEGFPLVIGEAASCGLPLVTTAVGGSEHLVEEGVTGFIVEADARALAARFDVIASQPDLLARMRQAIYEKSLKLSWDAQATQVLTVIEKRLGHSRQGC